MIVRDFPIEDYTGLDPVSFPIGSVEHILEEISRCCDPAYMAGLTKRELEWYARETKFSHSVEGASTSLKAWSGTDG